MRPSTPAAHVPYLIALVLFLLAPSTPGAVLDVPGTYATIQAAIDAAAAGDEVRVAPGTYVECIDFRGKGIRVFSTGGAAVTVIDGGRLGSVVTFATQEGLDAVLEGFTVTNGAGTNLGNATYGGGSSSGSPPPP